MRKGDWLADAASPNEVDDREKNDGAEERPQESLDGQGTVDVAFAQNQAGKYGADNADDERA